jgi:hypothetical protein
MQWWWKSRGGSSGGYGGGSEIETVMVVETEEDTNSKPNISKPFEKSSGFFYLEPVSEF